MELRYSFWTVKETVAFLSLLPVLPLVFLKSLEEGAEPNQEVLLQKQPSSKEQFNEKIDKLTRHITGIES